MPPRKRPPTDHTGAKREQLEKEHAEELQRRSSEMAMAARVQAEAKDEVIDYAGTEIAVDEEAILVGDGSGEALPEAVEQPWETVGNVPAPRGSDGSVVIRVNADLEDVTIGAGNNYSFVEGGQYRVPLHVAQHLEEKGYIWH